jgi:hypothetical protein
VTVFDGFTGFGMATEGGGEAVGPGMDPLRDPVCVEHAGMSSARQRQIAARAIPLIRQLLIVTGLSSR